VRGLALQAVFARGILRIVRRLIAISDPKFEPTASLEIRRDEVHLWQVELTGVRSGEARWREIISDEEQRRADRFRFRIDRQNFTAARALLRILVGAYAGLAPQAVTFSYAKQGKPSLNARQQKEHVEFNLSHSGEIALLAFARGRAVGVDVERLRKNLDPEKIARRYFSRYEQKELSALPPEERYLGFFRCWTRKEAYIKARAAGLSLPLDEFDVSLKPGDQNALFQARGQDTDITAWSLGELAVPNGYVAALCVQGNGWRLIS
jgi:4'-phosphopantetheinyl transferase